MPRGGRRAGAGRKSGDAWASKAPEPVRALARAKVQEILTSERDPLDVLVRLAFDEEQDPTLRVQAAAAAMPYLRPRLSAMVAMNVPAGGAGQVDAQQLLQCLNERLARLAPPVTLDAEPAEHAA